MTPEQREYARRWSRASAEALLTVINDILDFSKIEAGKLELDPIEFDLRERFGDTLQTLALRAHAKGLELACDIDADVPDARRRRPGRLRQVLVNLVGNAIKFTDRGEVVVARPTSSRSTATASSLHFCRQRHGHRHPAGKAATDLRGLRAGRRLDDAPITAAPAWA